MDDAWAFAPIRLESGALSVEVLPQGAALHRVVVKGPGSAEEERDIIAGPEVPFGHVSEGRRYYTQIVGRYANRLLGGKSKVTTEHGDIELNLDPNLDGERFCLHAGYSGYDLRAFERVPGSHPLVAELYSASRDSDTEVFLHLHSPDGDQGFPGALDTIVRVEAGPPSTTAEGPYGRQAGVVTYEIKARLAHDAPATGTPVNMTLHAGYLLKRREESDGIRGQKLAIKAKRMVGVDGMWIPTGTLDETAGTPLHVARGDIDAGKGLVPLGAFMAESGIDHCYVFDRVSDSPQAALQSASGDCTLLFRTNQSAVQCYTANSNDGTGTRKAAHGKAAGGYPKQSIVFLEFQAPPATFLHRALRDVAGHDTILKPGRVYHNRLQVEIWQRATG